MVGISFFSFKKYRAYVLLCCIASTMPIGTLKADLFTSFQKSIGNADSTLSPQLLMGMAALGASSYAGYVLYNRFVTKSQDVSGFWVALVTSLVVSNAHRDLASRLMQAKTGDAVQCGLASAAGFFSLKALYEWYITPATQGDSLIPNDIESYFSIPTLKLSDLGGDIPAEVGDLVEYIKNPTSHVDLGVSASKGYLFLGPPGTGKTLTAQAIAGELGAVLIHVSAPSLESKWIGEGARKTRDIFATAHRIAEQTGLRVIIFIDEIDAVATNRENHMNEHSRQILLQLLCEIDQARAHENIFIFAATNYAEQLDPAIIRSGRLESHITFELPDEAKRRDILQRNLNKISALSPHINYDELVLQTVFFNCSDLDLMVKNASNLAVRERREKKNNTLLTQVHLVSAAHAIQLQKIKLLQKTYAVPAAAA